MGDFDPRAAKFLRESIGSVWTLELLRLLYGPPQNRWTVEQANRELRATPALVASRLKQLEELGLVCNEEAESWRFCARTAELADTADILVKAYRDRPFTVVGLLFANKENALHAFADSFVFWGKEN
jgi:hypothetical protein